MTLAIRLQQFQREIRIVRSKMHFRRLEFRRWTIITEVIRLANAFHILAKYTTLLATLLGLASTASRNIAVSVMRPLLRHSTVRYSTSSPFPSLSIHFLVISVLPSAKIHSRS